MGLLSWLRPKKTGQLSIGQTLTVVNGSLITPTDNKEAYICDGYTYNDIIYSIINLILDKVRLPEWNQYKVVDESSLKSYIGLMKRKDLSFEDIKKAKDLKTKALELTKGDPKLADLLKWANKRETFSDFVANGTGFLLLTGDRMVLAEMLKEGANSGKPHHLYNLFPQEVTIEATQTFPAEVVSYKMTSIAKSWTIQEVLHEAKWNPEYNYDGTNLYGLSPLKAALRTYTRNNYAKTASASAFKNQGVKGVLSADVDPSLVDGGNVGVLVEQANKVKQLLTGKEYSGPENYNKIASSGYRMNWTEIGLSPVDMDIIASEQWDMSRLCAIYGVPPQLLGSEKTSTYNNVREAEKALTARVALPLLTSFRNMFNQKLQSDWGYKDKNIYVDFDQTVFTELDENTRDKVDWVSKLWMLPPNKQLELMNIERIDNPLFDEPWIDNSRVPLSEFMANEVDNELMNDRTGNNS